MNYHIVYYTGVKTITTEINAEHLGQFFLQWAIKCIYRMYRSINHFRLYKHARQVSWICIDKAEVFQLNVVVSVSFQLFKVWIESYMQLNPTYQCKNALNAMGIYIFLFTMKKGANSKSVVIPKAWGVWQWICLKLTTDGINFRVTTV